MSIRLEKVSKTFNGFKALDSVDLEFADGELTAVLGPSGSGKTTLLRIIAGLDEPDPVPGGRILFDGEDVSGRDVGLRGVGFVFQHYALFRHLTVFENVAFGLRVKRRRERPTKAEIRDRVLDLLRLVGLEGLSARMPSELSGGQRQRVALARALAIRPKVLLLDEPFGALDAKVRTGLRRWLRDLHDRLRFTSVFVTHDQEEALEIADRVVLVNRGRIEQAGSPEEVFCEPANEFVMRFLGEVNVMGSNGSSRLVRPHDIGICLDGGPGKVEAVVKKTLTAGPLVKIDLVDRSGMAIRVHASHGEYESLAVGPGSRVYLLPRKSMADASGRWEKNPL